MGARVGVGCGLASGFGCSRAAARSDLIGVNHPGLGPRGPAGRGAPGIGPKEVRLAGEGCVWGGTWWPLSAGGSQAWGTQGEEEREGMRETQ